ncbi:MAG: YdcF family protein [Candidatus Magasanikbacteria bacterium]|nr:YdcF family protein [Candidatus Magasanikbacteria bacterium]
MKRIIIKNPLARLATAIFGTAVVSCLVLVIILAVEVRTAYSDKIFHEANSPDAVYGVVLGASIDPKTMMPGTALKDRLDTGIDLLKSQKVMGLIVTGDDGKWESNEVGAMVNYLHSQGVPDDILFVDGGSYRTFDSCEHLKAKGFDNVILISQEFHLPRALYLCNKIGVQSSGVIADKRWYPQIIYYWTRDILASTFAYFDVRGFNFIVKGPRV